MIFCCCLCSLVQPQSHDCNRLASLIFLPFLTIRLYVTAWAYKFICTQTRTHIPTHTLAHRGRHTSTPTFPFLTSTSSPTRPWGEAAWHQTVIPTLGQLCNRSEREKRERKREEEKREYSQLIIHRLTGVVTSDGGHGLFSLKRKNRVFVKSFLSNIQ